MAFSLRDVLTKIVTGIGPSKDGEAQDTRAAVAKWQDELKAAQQFFDKFHQQADKATDRYLDEASTGNKPDLDRASYRLNLYHSNIITLQSMLFSKIPKVEADRRFFDPTDDVARVASEMVTRILQNDMNDPDDKLADVLKSALQDRLIAGLGDARVKYCMNEEPAPVDPAAAPLPEGAPPPTVKTDEWCDVVYNHWRDTLWSPARVAAEVRWKAYRSYMPKEKVEARFGEEVAKNIPYGKASARMTGQKVDGMKLVEPEAEIWEIWDQDSKMVYWVVLGYDQFLDQKDDPTTLDGFYPGARPMLANLSTKRYLPKPDYTFAQDLYEEIDELETRIALLTKAVKAVGVYDRSSKEIGRMLNEGVENQMIPVDNWAMFAEKGGLKGMTDWLPLQDVVNSIDVLSAQQASRINQLYQVTGLSDIMRGQATQQNVTATEQRIKAQFGSGRVQAIQEEFATFASDLLNKKVQLIQRFYDPERIKTLSNIMNTPDAQFADQAVALIKNHEQFNVRISVKAESMAQENIEAVRQERSELIQGVAQFFGMATPMIEKQPESAPYLLKILQFAVAGYRGANEMEGLIDQFAAAATQKLQQPPPPPPPDPAMVKAQADAQAMQQQAQIDSQKAAQEGAIAAQEHQAKMQELAAQSADRQREFDLQMAQMVQQAQNDREAHNMRMQELDAKIEAIQETTKAKVAAAKEPAAEASND